MRSLFFKVIFVCVLASCLIVGTPAKSAVTDVFSDLPGAVFHDLPDSGSADPFGPLVLSMGGGNFVTVTSKEYEPGSTTTVEEDPAILGTYNLLADVLSGFTAPVDPSIAPGDYAGEYENNANVVLNFDKPLTSVGATFTLFYFSGPAKTSVQITAYDGPDNTGNVLGTTATPDNPYLGEPFPSHGIVQYLYFVGVHTPTPQIRSLLIQPSVAVNGFALDGIAVAGAASLEGDLDGDGFVGITDLNIVLGAWNQNVPPADPAADPSGDNFIGIEDLNIVLGNWNAGTPPIEASNEVPEPSALLLLTAGGAACLRRRVG